jgi:predicted phage terminase large subunit-like protein
MSFSLLSPEKPLDAAWRRYQMLRERESQEESLGQFVTDGWRHIDPVPFKPGWHLDAIAEHLEAVTNGDVRKLIINVPPRTSKSSMVSVAFPAWTWAQPEKYRGPLSGPHVQFLFASYAQTLSIRDSVKTRRLIASPWYQQRWGNRFKLAGDQNAKVRFDNDQGGYRLATSVDGALTGEGGSIIVIDDPHNATEMESDLVRNSTIDWWDGAMSTRLNDPSTGAYIVIMQRLHEEDLTGHILSQNNPDWVHLCLPMRYEPERHCTTAIGWSDPREDEGELLCVDRFDETSVAGLEAALGPFRAAGQLQQRPEPKGGGIFKREWWEDWDKDRFPTFEIMVASLDCAYTEKEENDPSALSIWGIYEDTSGIRCAMLVYAWSLRLEFHGLVEKTAETCTQYGVDMLLIESKASGISVSQELARLYSHEDWGIALVDPKSQDKVARAYSVQGLLECGLVGAPTSKAWADKLISQASSFPKGKHDDLVDTTTQALKWLRENGYLRQAAERKAERKAALALPERPSPLYDV